ncbi:MAG: hypothetical protein IJF45_07890, partial [Clostridia bacterium]|nr:hypothetical protein [Clostridia bacterium]
FRVVCFLGCFLGIDGRGGAGFTTTDYGAWPMIAKSTLIVAMFIGGMAGSTAGSFVEMCDKNAQLLPVFQK